MVCMRCSSIIGTVRLPAAIYVLSQPSDSIQSLPCNIYDPMPPLTCGSCLLHKLLPRSVPMHHSLADQTSV